MPIKLANNASTRLASPITAASTSLTVESGGGDKFPVTDNDVYFPMTIVAADGQLEIVKCTARSSDTFTIERAQEGTTAKDFAAGSAVELRLTAGAMEDVINDAEERLQDIVDSLEGYKVGDYLTTARNPGPNWLRRNGGVYPADDYPELAPLMPDVPSSFSFNEIEKVIPSGNIENIGRVNGRLIATAGVNQAQSLDDGETWTLLPSEGKFCRTPVYFGGKYLFGSTGGKILVSDDLSLGSFTEVTIPGTTTQYSSLSASATAVIACGHFQGNNHYLVRATSPTGPFTSLSIPSGAKVMGSACVKGVFVVFPDSESTGAISFNDGVSFSAFSFASRPFRRLKVIDGQIYGYGGGALYAINDAFTTFTQIDTPAGFSVAQFFKVDGRYVIMASSGAAHYSTDLANWIPFTVTPPGSISNGIELLNDEDIILTCSQGSMLKGRYVPTIQFQVPSDGGTNGWIKAK